MASCWTARLANPSNSTAEAPLKQQVETAYRLACFVPSRQRRSVLKGAPFWNKLKSPVKKALVIIGAVVAVIVIAAAIFRDALMSAAMSFMMQPAESFADTEPLPAPAPTLPAACAPPTPPFDRGGGQDALDFASYNAGPARVSRLRAPRR